MSIPQTEQQAAGDYRLDVTDFGPIVKASVDLRPLTVFIGPSNTGKSYLAILMYALHQCFGGPDTPPHRGRFPRREGWPIYLFSEAVRPGVSIRRSLKDWLSKVVWQEDSLPALPTDVATHIRSTLEQARGLDRYLEQEIRRCFGVDRLGELVRYPGSHAKASIDLRVSQGGPEAVRYQLEFDQKGVRLSGQISESISLAAQLSGQPLHEDVIRAKFVAHEVEKEAEGEHELVYLLRSLAQSLFTSLIRPISRNAYYLPADRTGVMHSHQVVVSTLVQNATTAGLRPSTDVPMLSGVLADFLNSLIRMSRRRAPLRKPAGRHERILESNILKGTVQLDRAETGYPIFAYRPSGWKSDLPLMRVSSMVSELAPVVLYLRHLVRPGDVLIIEEPESHLHPAMQTVFARELARLAHSGIRVVVTTHSEWLLDQFANLVRLSALPKDERKGIPGADEALQPEQFGAWLFKQKQRPKGSVVEEIRVDPEAGGLLTDYGDIAEQLYNEWAEIGNRMTESGR